VSRHSRRTAPLDSKLGVLATYDEQEPHLIAAEWRGRVWVFAQATARRPLTDIAILELHDAMFAPLLDWAGRPRTKDVGPGGKVEVPFARVREELRKLGDDFDSWRAAIGEDPTLEQIAGIIADAHHRFQWIHPFVDTNGRTGRVLDLFVLWSCFGLASGSMETSPVIEYFPDRDREDEYYAGLLEADLHRPERLRSYYLERLERALHSVFTVHWWDGSHTTTCVAIHVDAATATEDALARSAKDRQHQYRVLGEGARIVVRAFGGHLIDEGGHPIPGGSRPV
jgi:fido (protein-threonine AMPylation protein)